MSGNLARLRTLINDATSDQGFAVLYGQEAIAQQKKRYIGLLDQALAERPELYYRFISVPGRTELGGNHTDHNNGRVLAAAVDLDCVALVGATGEQSVALTSSISPAPVSVKLDELSPIARETGTAAALVRGVAAAFVRRGCTIAGFAGYLHSTCPTGAGLSSSAAFSLLIGASFASLDKDASIDPVELAHRAHFAENTFFGKPCGLMDQLSCGIGTIIAIDFRQPQDPAIKPITVSLQESGYRLVIVDTGSSHVELTAEYGAIPEEMRRAAAVLGQRQGRGISIEQLMEKLPEVRSAAGDRALLRLLHFINEDQRAADQTKALADRRYADFLELVRRSGDSSCKLLQNCASAQNSREQGVLLALTLSEQFFPEAVCRVHGGGFAGTIQAYVPHQLMEHYQTFIARIFGAGSVLPVRLGRPGIALFDEAGWQFSGTGGG